MASPRRGSKSNASSQTLPAIQPPDDALSITWWAIDDVRPYAKNPRRNDGAVAKVAASLREYGWRQPIVVDAEGVVIVGHTRLKAAQSLGHERVPVHIARGLSAKQVRAYRLADNRTAEEADWDIPLLVEELATLRVDDDLDLETLGALTAFELPEIERLLGESAAGGGARGEIPTELGI